jgi:hypothetical protein
MGLVGQDPRLFHTTIAEIITHRRELALEADRVVVVDRALWSRRPAVACASVGSPRSVVSGLARRGSMPGC